MPKSTVVSAPARADFLNTHQDYKRLPVVPVGLDLRIFLRARPVDGNTITVRSEDLQEYDEHSTDSFQVGQNEILEKGFFGNYLRAALNVIIERKTKNRISGLEMNVRSNIPIGSGLASSAALTVAFVALLSHQFKLGYGRRQLAEIAYIAESERVGTHCGRLDQYGVSFGGVIKLDCKPPYRVDRLPFTNLTFTVADSGIRHSTQDVHPKRQLEIDRGLRRLMASKSLPRRLRTRLGYTFDQPDWHALSEKMLQPFLSTLDDEARKRILFTIRMNRSTDLAIKILRNTAVTEREIVSRLGGEVGYRIRKTPRHERNYLALGEVMNEQHVLLRDLYEVSMSKIDGMCSAALAAGAYGAKLSGAGMGGSIIALVKDERIGRKVLDACLSAGAKNGWVSRVGEGVRVEPP
jgi:galactokinase